MPVIICPRCLVCGMHWNEIMFWCGKFFIICPDCERIVAERAYPLSKELLPEED